MASPSPFQVGAIQPIEKIADAVKEAAPRVLVHSDGAQSVGKVPLDMPSLNVDLFTLVGHKFGAPKALPSPPTHTPYPHPYPHPYPLVPTPPPP